MVKNLGADAALAQVGVCHQGELQHLMVGRWFDSGKEKCVFTSSLVGLSKILCFCLSVTLADTRLFL